MALDRIGKRMSWGEAIRLTLQLVRDPSSHVGAAVAGWEYPVSRDALILMDLFDLQHASKSKRRPDPYPRPIQRAGVKRYGTDRLSPAELRAVLDRHREAG